ncbi:hypothetical protein GQ457_10G012340 [Hibiscus cannabinus]
MFFDVLSPIPKPVLPNSDLKASEFDFKPEPAYSIVCLAQPVRSAQFRELVITGSIIVAERSRYLLDRFDLLFSGVYPICAIFFLYYFPDRLCAPDTFLATARVIRPVLIGFWLCASVSPPVRHLCFGQYKSSCLAPMLRLG